LKFHLASLGHNEAAKIQGDRITLFHGTRASLEKIMREGLLICGGRRSRMDLVREALADFGLKIHDVPRWVWETAALCEANIEPHIHFSLNLGAAVAYAWQGCETRALVRAGALIWLLSRLLGENMSWRDLEDKGVSMRDIDVVAAKMNGVESHVIKVEVPIDYVRREDYEDILNAVQIYGEEYLSSTTMEVRVVKNVPPNMIKRVWRVAWDDGALHLEIKY